MEITCPWVWPPPSDRRNRSDPASGLGDSGGPVFVGGTAAGFIHGGPPIDGQVRMCFSQARYIDDAIGVSIKTS